MNELKIHNLAVLRASVEGRDLGSYFGSTLSLQHWITDSIQKGLITEQGPTELGRSIADRIRLTTAEKCRAYLWSTSTTMLASACELLRSPDVLKIPEIKLNAQSSLIVAKKAPHDEKEIPVVTPLVTPLVGVEVEPIAKKVHSPAPTETSPADWLSSAMDTVFSARKVLLKGKSLKERDEIGRAILTYAQFREASLKAPHHDPVKAQFGHMNLKDSLNSAIRLLHSCSVNPTDIPFLTQGET